MNVVNKRDEEQGSDTLSSTAVRSSSVFGSEKSFHSQTPTFTVIKGFEKKELEYKYIIPTTQTKIPSACYLILHLIFGGLYSIMFSQQFMSALRLYNTKVEKFSISTFLDFVRFGESTTSVHLLVFPCMLLSLIPVLILLLTLFIMWISKKQFTWTSRMFFEYSSYSIFISVPLFLDLMTSTSSSPEVLLCAFCRPVFLIHVFFFSGVPFKHLFRITFPFSMMYIFFLLILLNFYFKNSWWTVCTRICEFFSSWIALLITHYVNDLSRRRNFCVALEDKKTRKGLRMFVEDISKGTNTLIPLKYFQKNLKEYFLVCVKNKSMRYSKYSKIQHFTKTILLQADLVNFTEFCGRQIQTENPLKIANTLKKVFSIFDKIIEESPFVVISIVGDAYVILHEKNIVDSYDNVKEDENVMYDENMLAKVVEETIKIGQLMITRSRSVYGESIRVGICLFQCYSQVYSELNRIRFDIYGKGIELVDYIQKVAPVGCVCVCEKTEEALLSSFEGLEVLEKDETSSIKKFECPDFYKRKKVFLLTKNSLLDITDDNEDEMIVEKSLMSSRFKYLQLNKNVSIVSKKSKKEVFLQNFLSYISTLYTLFKFLDEEKLKNNEKNITTWKERWVLLCDYLFFLAKTKIKTSFTFTLLGLYLMIITPLLYFSSVPEYLNWQKYIVYWSIMIVCFIVTILVQMLGFVELWLYKKKKKYFFVMFFLDDFIKFLCIFIYIFTFELSDPKVSTYFQLYHYFLLITMIHSFSFCFLKEITIIISLFVILIFLYWVYLAFLYSSNAFAINRLLSQTLTPIVFFLMKEIYLRMDMTFFFGKMKNKQLRKKLKEKKEYNKMLLEKILPTKVICDKYRKKKNENKTYAKSCNGPVGRIEVHPINKGKNWERVPAVMEKINKLFGEFDDCIKQFGLFRVKCQENYYMFIERKNKKNGFLKSVLFALFAKKIAKRVKFGVSIGITCGSYVRGIAGGLFVQYDIYGDSPNKASRYAHVNNHGNIQTDKSEMKKVLGTCDGKVTMEKVIMLDGYKGLRNVETVFVKSKMREKEILKFVRELK